MENSVRDLWSLMNFVAPGYLGSRNGFSRTLREAAHDAIPTSVRRSVAWRAGCARSSSAAARPTSRASCRKRSSRSSPAISARRSARPTTRSCARSSRGSVERRGERRRHADENADRPAPAAPDLLRSAAAGSCRLTKRPETSAKLDLLDELLEEIIDGGHRVLVFSQFVKMLDLVRERLDGERNRIIVISPARRRTGKKRSTGFKRTKRFRSSSSA